jgi:hypothetical protein
VNRDLVALKVGPQAVAHPAGGRLVLAPQKILHPHPPAPPSDGAFAVDQSAGALQNQQVTGVYSSLAALSSSGRRKGAAGFPSLAINE